MSSLAQHFALEKEDALHPVNVKTVMPYHQNYKSLIETAKLNKDCSSKNFMGQIRNILLFVKSTKL